MRGLGFKLLSWPHPALPRSAVPRLAPSPPPADDVSSVLLVTLLAFLTTATPAFAQKSKHVGISGPFIFAFGECKISIGECTYGGVLVWMLVLKTLLQHVECGKPAAFSNSVSIFQHQHLPVTSLHPSVNSRTCLRRREGDLRASRRAAVLCATGAVLIESWQIFLGSQVLRAV